MIKLLNAMLESSSLIKKSRTTYTLGVRLFLKNRENI